MQISKELKSILEDRLADYKKNPNSGSTWEEVKRRIKNHQVKGRQNTKAPNSTKRG